MMIQRSFIFSLNCYGYFGAAKNVWIEWWMMEMESGKRRRGRGVFCRLVVVVVRRLLAARVFSSFDWLAFDVDS